MSLAQFDSPLIFVSHTPLREVMRITEDGKLIPGEGLSLDEVTQGVMQALETVFNSKHDKVLMENERMRSALEKLHNVLFSEGDVGRVIREALE